MSSARSRPFLDGVLLMGLLAAAVFATLGPWRDIAGVALRDDEQSHILMGLPVAAWLAWVRRDRFRYAQVRRSMVGPALIFIGWLACYFGFANSIDLAWHGGAVVTVAGALVTMLGTDVVVKFLPAFAALGFLMPVPGRIRQQIAIPLQEVSAKVSEFGLDLFSLPVSRIGNTLTINGNDVAIAEACNGMRMVAALLLVTFAFIFTVPMRNSIRILLLLLSPLVAVVVNIVRLVPTTLFYGYSDKTTADLFHDISGWAVLVLALGILWIIISVLRWIEVPIAPYAVSED